MQTTGPITIPEGFFPPHGVPFETEAQRDVGCAMHRAGLLELQFDCGTWNSWANFDGSSAAHNYRLAPPKPRTVGPFETIHMREDANGNAWGAAIAAAISNGFKNYRIKLTATAEEIL